MKQITQAELRAVLDVYNQSLELADQLQRRLQDGAEVEPGKFAVENEYAKSLDEFSPTVTLAIGGLDIKPATSGRPDWLLSTPTVYYGLEARPGGFKNSQPERIDLTAVEYETLKAHLAKMRGIAVPEVAHASN